MKKIMSILLVLTVVISLFAGCKKTEVTSSDTSDENNQITEEAEQIGQEDSEQNEPLVIAEDDESKASSFEAINDSFNDGEIDEATYHTSIVALVTGITSDSTNESYSFRENEFIDPSRDAQWLVDNYDTLDETGKSLVDQLTRIEPLANTTSSINLPFVIRSYASATEDEPKYPLKIMEGAYLTVPDVFSTIPDGVEHQIISDYVLNEDLLGLPIGIRHSTYRIIISVYPMMGAASSLSFLDRDIRLEGESLPTFYIHLNMSANSDTLKGALLHELFHAFQYELGYERITEHDNFLMESTAIWAVKHLDNELEYPDQFDKYIYSSDLKFDVTSMTDNEMKSWYQLPYMMVDEVGDDDFVLKYLKSGLTKTTLVDTLNDTFENPTTQVDMFARFGKYLIADIDNSDIAIPSEAPYFSDSLDASNYIDTTFEEFSQRVEADAMSEYGMIAPGYYPVHIDLSEYKDGILHIVSNAFDISKHNNTGLVIFYKKEDTWKLAISGEMESFRISELDFKDNDITDLLFLFFNHNDVQATQKFSLIMQEKILGEGSIRVAMDVDYKMDDDESVLEDEASFILDITENIELLTSGNTETDMGMAAKFIMGDVYYVKDFEAIISGNRTTNYTDGSSRLMSYSGRFNFNEGDVVDGELPNSLLGPEISGLLSGIFGDNSSGSLDLGGILDGGGLDLGGIDLGGLIGDDALADLDNELSEARDELADIDIDALGLFMPNPNKLMRIKTVLQNETFHFYPALPPKLESTDWVNVEMIYHYKGADGKMKTEASIKTSTLLFTPIPLWFRNPYYSPIDPEELMLMFPRDPAVIAEEFTDMDNAMDQMIMFNGKYDESNLYNAFDDGSYTFDLLEVSPSKAGTQTQELSLLNEDTFIGTITADYIDNSGVLYDVEIDIKYEYK